MIGYLEGKIIKVSDVSSSDNFVIVLVSGVGYRVSLVPRLASSVKEGANLQIYTYTHVREDALSLFGFADFDELLTFEVLLSISGIGPRLAFNILNSTSINSLRQAVVNTDVSVLTKIPGIGKRSAEKIMLELTNKFKVKSNLKKMLFSPDEDLAIQALEQLGYTGDEARNAVKEVKGEESLEKKIMASLKIINKNK